MSVRTTVAHLFVVVSIAVSCFATTHYICPGAAGTNDGSSWTNAYTGIGSGTGNIAPSSMIRGDTYLLANGQITPAASTTTFSVADSGTNVITIQKATDTSHGTNTGWTNGGTGACNSGQAVFGPILFTTDYWTLNGVYRGNNTGYPWLDWRTNYGILVNNYNGTTAGIETAGYINSSAAVQGGQGTTPVTNLTVEYTEIVGSHNGGQGCNINNTDSPSVNEDNGIELIVGQTGNDYFGYNYIHDVGTAGEITCAGCSNTTVEYNWSQNNCYTHTWHSAMFNFKDNYGSSTANLNIRYNYLENSMSTAAIATPGGSGWNQPSNWAIYGNVFFYNAAEAPSYNGQAGGNGDGAIFIWNFQTFGGYLYIYNNTISGLSIPGYNASITLGLSGQSNAMGTVNIYNNVWYDEVNHVVPPTCPPAGCTSFNYGYSSYYNCASNQNQYDTSTAVQIASGGLLENVGQSANQDDFRLAFDTSSWYPLPSPYNMDMIGSTRTSSRGAFQFDGGSAPLPPSALTAIVQ